MNLGITVTVDIISQGIFYILVLVFVIHALSLTYHWFSYGIRRSTSLLALAVYLVGGSVFLLTMSILMFNF